MLDVSVSYNRYKFLGYEFLTWLWFTIESDPDQISAVDPEISALEIGNRVVLENHAGGGVETITIKGDDAGLEEGVLALRKGAMVVEMNLAFKVGEDEWRFSLKGESLDLTQLKPPATAALEAAEEMEGALLEKAYLCERAVTLVDSLFFHFIRLRVSEAWHQRAVVRLKQWIHSSARS